MKVSVLILTKNEERDLPECLASIAWSDDIWVYDSFSDDQTVEIAEQFGAKVVRRQFDDWSTHQNWGLANIPFKHEWVFYIDADERATATLKANIEAIDPSACKNVAFRLRRRDFLQERWLRHVQASPFYIRIFKPQSIHYERLVNPITVVNGEIVDLPGYLDHHPFSKGLTHWIARHNSYSSLEAREIISRDGHAQARSFIRGLFSKDFNKRRESQKAIFYKLPCRAVTKFLLLYVIRLGFLDGRAGFHYALLQSIYEQLIVFKTRELRDTQTRL